MTTKKFFALIFLTTLTQSAFAGLNEDLFEALKNKNFKNVQKLVLESEANVNCVDNGGYSPLLTAAEKQDTASALLLLENGAQVDFQSRLGGTSLMFAASNNDLEMATLLIVFNADALIKEKDIATFKEDKINKGLTAREIAIRKQSLYVRDGKVIDQKNLTTNKILQKLLEKTEQEQQKKISGTQEIKDSRHDSAIDLFEEGQAAQDE
jgi:ankyrin repeat protein